MIVSKYLSTRSEKFVIMLHIKFRVKTRCLTNMKTVGHLTLSTISGSKVPFKSQSRNNWRHKKEK